MLTLKMTHRSDTDPALLSKVGDFFMSHSQYDKAVQLFVTGKQVARALELCEKYNVTVTEEVNGTLARICYENSVSLVISRCPHIRD